MKNTGISALTDMTKIDDQSPESTQAARLRDTFFNTRQSINEQYGLTCWGRDGDDRLWSIWRDDGDVQLTPWQDLGPHGLIWVVWADEHDPEKLVLALERRDDDAQPPMAEIYLLRLPDGERAPQRLSADYSVQVEAFPYADGQVLLKWLPHEEDADMRTGFGLMDLEFRERVPPIAHAPKVVWEHPHLVRYLVRDDAGKVAWAVSDVHTGQQVIPPVYEDLTLDVDRWIGNRREGGCDVLSLDGRRLMHHDHWLHPGNGDGRWFFEKDGLWGYASPDGHPLAEPRHESQQALWDEPVALGTLLLPAEGNRCTVLPASLLKRLRAEAAKGGTTYKFEGLANVCPPLPGDGYVDLCRALMPDGHKALLLTLRYESERWLVLTHPWQGLRTGSLLRLGAPTVAGDTPLIACLPESGDESFVRAIVDYC